MTEAEYNEIKPWDIIKDIETGDSFTVGQILADGLEMFNQSGLTMDIPKTECIKKFEVTHTKYIPSYYVLHHFIDLYEQWQKEKNKVVAGMYIQNNW